MKTTETSVHPVVGDPVLYREGGSDITHLGVVVAVAEHDGDADIDYLGRDLRALDVKRGDGPHTYQPL